MQRLLRSFYARHSPEVAPDLLGKVLVRLSRKGKVSGRIVEVEAYTGESDPGSHAYRGPRTRNLVMFGPPGHVYVYLSHGIHHCMNVVTDPPGVAGAVLLRALEPLEGIPIMETNRGGRPLLDLCSGPGKLCRALGITLQQNGEDLEGSEMWIEDDGFAPDRIAVSTRIGLSAGAELPLRFYLPDNPYISRAKPSVPPPCSWAGLQSAPWPRPQDCLDPASIHGDAGRGLAPV